MTEDNVEIWKKLECQDCDNKDGLEFATGDGDEPKSVIFCGTCSGKVKAYIIKRGYDIDFNDYFGPPYCQLCGNDQLEELRLPVTVKTKGSEHVLCLDCIHSE